MKDSGKQSHHWLLWGLTLALLLLLAGLLARSGVLQAIRSVEELRDFLQATAPYSHLVYFLLQLTSVILAPIPSNLVAGAGGLLFGPLPAFCLTMGAVTLGSCTTFSLARVLGRNFAQRVLSEGFFAKYGPVIQQKRDVFLFLAFLFPLFPDDLLCILAGLTDIPFRRFFLLVILARPWGLLGACILGGSVLQLPWWALVLLVPVGGGVFFLVLRYGDRWEDAILQQLNRR